jgi:hypothetical protein
MEITVHIETPEEIAKRQKLIDRANSVSYDITNINCF